MTKTAQDWTYEQERQLLCALKAGYTQAQMSETLGRSPRAIRHKLLRMRRLATKEIPFVRPDPWTDAEKDTLRRMVADGATDAAIAGLLGRPVGGVRTMRQNIGLAARRPATGGCGIEADWPRPTAAERRRGEAILTHALRYAA
jgi:DNA-binding NarL/FixJ family response regulator